MPPGSRVRTTVRPALGQPRLEPLRLRGLARGVAALEGDEEPVHALFGVRFFAAVEPVRPRAGVFFGAGPFARLSASICTASRELHGQRVLPARHRDVRLAVGDVGAEAAVLDPDRLAADRVRVELLQRARGPARAVLRLREQLEGAGQVDREDAVLVGQRAGVGALLQVRPVPAVLRRDRLAALGVVPDRARQVEQLHGGGEVDASRATST